MRLPFVSRRKYDEAQQTIKSLEGFIKELQPEFRAATVDVEQYKAQCKRLNVLLDRAEKSAKHYKDIVEQYHKKDGDADEYG